MAERTQRQLGAGAEGHGSRAENPRPALRVVQENDSAPVFAWEAFSAIAHELTALFRRHHDEVAVNKDAVPLDPNWKGFFALETAGMLACLTCRVEGELVGYHLLMQCVPFMYASTPWAQTLSFWLDPRFRKGLTGYRLLSIAKRTLRENGCKLHAIGIKLHNRKRIAPILARLGYRPVEAVFQQVL